ncbi:MAG: hypothetical protein C5B58_12080 [Acidobacteria bacterium]|nr:MAG: hypothetical protein C5B58_12080 [Acidobacteriota bacterium]
MLLPTLTVPKFKEFAEAWTIAGTLGVGVAVGVAVGVEVSVGVGAGVKPAVGLGVGVAAPVGVDVGVVTGRTNSSALPGVEAR